MGAAVAVAVAVAAQFLQPFCRMASLNVADGGWIFGLFTEAVAADFSRLSFPFDPKPMLKYFWHTVRQGAPSLASCAKGRRLVPALAFMAAFCGALQGAWAEPSHAYAYWGEPKYPAGFAHFDYVNPQAPKGGELRMVSNLRISAFDKYNPFTMRGSAPAYLVNLMFESLLMPSLDEPATAYAWLAESVDVAPDGLSVTFRIRAQAHFNNGDAVQAQDVVFSYETLRSNKALPAFATIFADVKGAQALDARTVRFIFAKPSRELPLIVGSMPIFSPKWGRIDGEPQAFDSVVMAPPIATGPYLVGPVDFGRDITYVRDPHYWGQGLNVMQGRFNFDRISVPIYQDNTAKLEALKAGQFDFMQFFSAGDWARRVQGRKFDTGALRKATFAHSNPAGFQSYILNVRKPYLQDVRVRQALNLAMDYEWMNSRLFYHSYQRVHGLFGNTQCQAQGAPSEAELALLQPWRAQLQPAVFEAIEPPPTTDGAHDLRANLRQAAALLEAAGWHIVHGQLRNAQGQPLVLEYLTSGEGGIRSVSPWIRNLEKLGITLEYRSVDYAVYVQRLRNFDYDLTSLNFMGTHNPGQEYADLFGSQAADTPDSGNYSGLKNPAVDALVAQMVGAQNATDFHAACRALERVVVSEQVLIPQWYSGQYRAVYNPEQLTYKAPMPLYTEGAAVLGGNSGLETWVQSTWWHP